MSDAQFEATFPDEDACKAYLEERRWPNGVHCPRCGSATVRPIESLPWNWRCGKCNPGGYKFSITVGTQLEYTHKPLRDWFRILHAMVRSKEVITARQIWQLTSIGTYETVRHMYNQIRAGLAEPHEKLGGIVEFNQTCVDQYKRRGARQAALAMAAQWRSGRLAANK
jgi:transposase-like protein